MRSAVLVFLVFVLAVGGLTAFAWERTGRDRYAALEQEGRGLAGVLRGAALEAQAALRTAVRIAEADVLDRLRETPDLVARLAGYEIREGRVPREMLYLADEVFFTGTASEITPIRSIDRQPVGAGSG